MLWTHLRERVKGLGFMSSDTTIKATIQASGVEIAVLSSVTDSTDYLSLTDIARHKNPEFPADVVKNWMRIRSTIEFLGLWEQLNNPCFKLVEFDQFKIEAGSNAFVLSPQKWITATNAIGMQSKAGRYGGGTFAHTDIAFEFASWVSPEFKLYIIKDYQRLKLDEAHRLALDWNVKRLLAKANYRIHTDAIKAKLIPSNLTKKQEGFIYADEADMLNVALFGKTAAQWRKENPKQKGNIRDYATIEQLLVMTNLENANALFIDQGMAPPQRIRQLRSLAVSQMETLSKSRSAAKLNELHNQLKLPTGE